MANRPAVPEPAVDELKRRARRRLVGAVVVALAAAVLLPLLLENEPKPIGDDVMIQIPPVDSGKFINPLSSARVPDPKLKGDAANARNAVPPLPPSPSAAAPTAASPTPKESAGDSETQVSAMPPSTAPVIGAPPATALATPSVDSKIAVPDNKAAASLPAAAKPGSDAVVEPKTAAAAAATATAAPEAARTDAVYVVQIAAFSDHYGARSLASKLKRGGFPGYTEAVTTDKGTLHRVRVGPYPSREAAVAALAKLKAAGYNGMVAHVG